MQTIATETTTDASTIFKMLFTIPFSPEFLKYPLLISTKYYFQMREKRCPNIYHLLPTLST